MSRKYFVISDIHSFYDEMMKALDNVGYDVNNKEHILIVCGDVFDRGKQTIEVYRFLSSIPDDRLVLVGGNHEDLYLDLLIKDKPDMYDVSNGTVKTFLSIAGLNVDDSSFMPYFMTKDIYRVWESVKNTVKNSEVTKWINSKKWVNYYELDKYIFVHSFIPVKRGYGSNTSMKDWRTKAKAEDWFEAKWGCPPALYLEGLFDEEKKNGKIIVCGHWHTSDFYRMLDDNREDKVRNYCPIYIKDNIIGIDACTASTERCNCLVIDENMNVLESSSGYYKRGN